MPDLAYIALGSNLGDRPAFLAAARSAISLAGIGRLRAASSVEETIPLGSLPQAPYLNQMIAIEPSAGPLQVLERLQSIERSLGRVRGTRWGSRTIDLDIVRYANVHMETARLRLPHPGIADRDFWQRELAELTLLVS